MKSLKILTCALLLLGMGAASIHAASSVLSKDLQNISSTAQLDVIVQFTTSTTTTILNSVKANGGTLKNQFGKKMALYNLPAVSINALPTNAYVKHASPDRVFKSKLEFAHPTINADIALSFGWDGTGIGIAVVDSGISSSHADLMTGKTARTVYSQSFVPGDTTTNDAYGHGTHVAGILNGDGSDSSGSNAIHTFLGIAPNSNLINLRVLDANGQGTDSALIGAIQQAIALKNTYNIRVLNLSVGRPVFESYTVDPLCQAVESAWQAGIVVVVAAGNSGRDNSMGTSGYSTITSPGNDPYVITVGAMKDMGTVGRNDDMVASYSSKGPTLLDQVVKPDLVAPGNRIVSALSAGSAILAAYPANVIPINYYRSGSTQASQDYFRLSGTSMAAPMVSGAAALLLQKTGTLTPDQVKAILMATATKTFPTSSIATDPATGAVYTSYYDAFTIGAGYLDVLAALNAATIPASGASAISPKAVYDASTGNVDFVTNSATINGVNVVWGTNVVWGSNVVWGTNVVWGSSVLLSGTNVVWGPNVVWGTSTASGFNVVWGTNVVWGSSAPFSEALSINGE